MGDRKVKAVELGQADAPCRIESPAAPPELPEAVAEPAPEPPDLMAEVQRALHTRRARSHNPAKRRAGWQLREALADGAPAVVLTWHGVQPPSYAATEQERQLAVTSMTAGALARVERYLSPDFTVHRLHEVTDTRPGTVLTALLIFRPEDAPEAWEF